MKHQCPKHDMCNNNHRWLLRILLAISNFLIGQTQVDGVYAVKLHEYFNDIPQFYQSIKILEKGPSASPKTPPPTGFVEHQENYDWGHYYRLVVLEGHRDDLIFLEKVKQLKIDSRVEKVFKVDLDVMFLGGEGFGNRFVVIEGVRWISPQVVMVSATYGTTEGLVSKEFELDLGKIAQ